MSQLNQARLVVTGFAKLFLKAVDQAVLWTARQLAVRRTDFF